MSHYLAIFLVILITATIVFILAGNVGREPAPKLCGHTWRDRMGHECVCHLAAGHDRDPRTDRHECACGYWDYASLPAAGRLDTYQPHPTTYGQPFPADTQPLLIPGRIAAAGDQLARDVNRWADEAERTIPARWR